MKQKKLPQVAITKRKYADNKALLINACKIDADTYHILQHDAAIAWIRANIWDDDIAVNAITEQTLFWAWWVNQWNIREDALVYEYLPYLISADNWSKLLHTAWVNAHTAPDVPMSHNEWLDNIYDKVINKTIKKIQI